jgi:drug/metabolite transporter (DMT)-like permease
MDYLLALLASLFWGVSDFLGGLKTRSVPLATVLLVSQVAGLLGIAVIVAARGQPFPGGDRMLWAAAAGVASIASLAFIYAATARGPIVVVAPVAALGAALPIIVGISQGNAVTMVDVLGIIFALCGVTIAGFETGQGGSHPRGFIAPAMALASALAAGAFLILLNKASHPDPFWATAIMRTSSCALILGYFAVRRPRGASPGRLGALGLLTIAVVGLTDMGAEVSFAAASEHGELSIISVLASLYPVITVLLAVTVLRDRVNRLQFCGAVLTIIGATLLASTGA